MAKGSNSVVGLGLDNDWQTEEDMRTLARAQVIRDDPKRLKKALKMAQNQIEALEGLDPVEDAKEDKAEGETDD